MDEQNPKQQVTELLRKAETVVIAASSKPSSDQIAAVIALTQMLDKLGKRPEPVFSGEAPNNLSYLPLNILHKQFRGLRDFIIELDTSKTEADKLKYVPEGKTLKIYITPFNGNFEKSDLSATYGDYHTDLLVMLGVSNPQELDRAFAEQKQLLDKTQIVSIMATQTQAPPTNKQLNWHDPQASSLCEMLMSMTEALQPGLLDNHIATSLLTGIVGATEHFTAGNTTPKVMTMAAQLMAAGADQGSIIKHLEKPVPVPKTNLPPRPESARPQIDNSELRPDQERSLPHHQPTITTKPHDDSSPKDVPATPASTPTDRSNVDRSHTPAPKLPEIKRPSDHLDTPANPNPPPKFTGGSVPSHPLSPLPTPTAPMPQISPPPSTAFPPQTEPVPQPPVPAKQPYTHQPSIVQPPASISQPDSTPKPEIPQGDQPPATDPKVAPASQRIDIESARQAVEEATKEPDPNAPAT